MPRRRMMSRSELPGEYQKVKKIRSNNISYIALSVYIGNKLLGEDGTYNNLSMEFKFVPYGNGGLFGYYDTYANYNYDIRISNGVLTFARGLHYLDPKNAVTKSIELGVEHSIRINGSSIYVDDDFIGNFKLNCGAFNVVNDIYLSIFGISNWRGGIYQIDAAIGDIAFISGNGTPYTLLTCKRKDGKVGMYVKEEDIFLFDNNNNFTVES